MPHLLMRARNPKQVYIVFCPAVRGAAEMILTPTTFRRDFFLLHFSFSDFVDQMLQPADCSHKERRVEEPNLAAAPPFLKWATHSTLTTRQRPMTSLRFFWHIFLCTTTDDKTDSRRDPGEIEIYNTPLLCRHSLTRCCWWRPRLSRQGGGRLVSVPLGQNLWVQGARASLGFGPRICTLGAPCS